MFLSPAVISDLIVAGTVSVIVAGVCIVCLYRISIGRD